MHVEEEKEKCKASSKIVSFSFHYITSGIKMQRENGLQEEESRTWKIKSGK